MPVSDLRRVQFSFSFNRIAGVIGSCTLVSVCWLVYVLWISDCTGLSRGIEENSRGSGRPNFTCICLIGDKYTFIVCGDSFGMLNEWKNSTTMTLILEMELTHCTMNKN